MNNYEKIKNMIIDEMAKLIVSVFAMKLKDAQNNYPKWLQKESEV